MIDQSGEKWLAWRRMGIGSSDAPVIMGISPYSTVLQLWEDKLGIAPKQEENIAMRKGKHFEAHARAAFELEMGFDAPAECIVHEKFPFLRASMDAVNTTNRVFAEIKYMGKKNYDLCVENRAPLDHHVPQVQHQFLCSGYERAFYVPYTLRENPDTGKNEIDEIAFIPQAPDREYIEKHLWPAEQNFWNLVTTQTPPEPSEKDELIVADPTLVGLAEKYAALEKEVNAKSVEMDTIKKNLIVFLEKRPIVRVGCIRMKRSLRQGTVNYKLIPELKNIDLNQYRSESKPATYFTVDKK